MRTLNLRLRTKLVQFVVCCTVLLSLVVVIEVPYQDVIFISGSPGISLTEPQGPQGIYEYRDSLGISPTIQIGEYQYSPVLSHNRRFLLFNSIDREYGYSDLFVYDRQFGISKQLTQSEGSEYLMSWSPDDNRIAYATYSDSNHRIMISDLAENVNSIDLPTVYPPSGISWLPDEENALILSFSIGTEGQLSQIYRLNIINQEIELLSDGRGSYAVPNVSPDGTLIAYFDFATFSLVVQNATDRTVNSMFAGLVLGLTSAWSPDGSRLAFSTKTTNGDADVTILDIRTGQSYTISQPKTDDFAPVWSPDGSRIVSISSIEASAVPCIFTVFPPFVCEPIDIWISPPSQYLTQQWGSASTFDYQLDW